jgi:hypothetical protein
MEDLLQIDHIILGKFYYILVDIPVYIAEVNKTIITVLTKEVTLYFPKNVDYVDINRIKIVHGNYMIVVPKEESLHTVAQYFIYPVCHEDPLYLLYGRSVEEAIDCFFKADVKTFFNIYGKEYIQTQWPKELKKLYIPLQK